MAAPKKPSGPYISGKDRDVSVRAGGIGITAEVTGLEATVTSLLERSYQLARAGFIAAQREATHELGLVDKYVPRNTGALAATGRVEYPRDEEGQVTAAIAYGDETVDYALIVHEDMEAVHVAPTKAKYLEETVYEEMELGEGPDRMMETIRSLIGGT